MAPEKSLSGLVAPPGDEEEIEVNRELSLKEMNKWRFELVRM